MVVVGDNGAPNDSIDTILNRNGGLRGGKGNLYEGGVRELFIVRCPGKVPAGRVNSSTMISTYDLLPTYSRWRDCAAQRAVCGREHGRCVSGAARARVRRAAIRVRHRFRACAASPKLAIQQGNYKSCRNPDGSRRELYLIPQDHAEATNLVSQGAYAALGCGAGIPVNDTGPIRSCWGVSARRTHAPAQISRG